MSPAKNLYFCHPCRDPCTEGYFFQLVPAASSMIPERGHPFRALPISQSASSLTQKNPESISIQLEKPASQKPSMRPSYGMFPEEPFLMRLIQ